MMKLLQGLAGAAVAVALLAAPAWAARDGDGAKKADRTGVAKHKGVKADAGVAFHRLFSGRAMARTAKMLDLTKEQQEKIRQALASRDKQIEGILTKEQLAKAQKLSARQHRMVGHRGVHRQMGHRRMAGRHAMNRWDGHRGSGGRGWMRGWDGHRSMGGGAWMRSRHGHDAWNWRGDGRGWSGAGRW